MRCWSKVTSTTWSSTNKVPKSSASPCDPRPRHQHDCVPRPGTAIGPPKSVCRAVAISPCWASVIGTTPTPWAGPIPAKSAFDSATAQRPQQRHSTRPRCVPTAKSSSSPKPGLQVKDTGVDLQRLMEATAFFETRFQRIQEGREDIDREVASLQSEIQALVVCNPCRPCAPPPSLEITVRIDAPEATSGELVFSY